MKALRWSLVAALLVLGCAHQASVEPGATNEPTRLALGWYEQSQGFDALEAYEILGLDQPIRFAMARRWDEDRVKILSYVIEPARLVEVAFLTLREPGRRAEVWIYATPQVYAPPVARNVIRAPGAGLAAGGGATSIAAEVAQPVLPGDFDYVGRPDEDVAGEPCAVVVGTPARRMRGLSRVELFLSRRTGVALRTSYYRGETEVRRVDIDPAAVQQVEGRWLPDRWLVTTADGERAELILHNRLVDVELPANLFTKHNLRVQRFPTF